MLGLADDDALRRLLAQVSRGDAATLAQLYDLTSPKLFGVILRIQRDRGLGEDVLQDAYLRIWQGAGHAMAEPKKQFTPKFRWEAVRLAPTNGRSRGEIAAGLGVGLST